jgi:hypothetical protein
LRNSRKVNLTLPDVFRTSRHAKFVVVGSASYAPEWLKKYYTHFRSLGYAFVAVNNAYRAFESPQMIEEWHHSVNFFKFNREHHPEQDHTGSVSLRDREYVTYPETIPTECSTTMVDALLGILDRYTSVDLLVVASDYNYSGNTHFYKSTGTLDPMRCGKDALSNNLAEVQRRIEASGSSVRNAGFHDETILPFPRYPKPDPQR